MNWLRLHVSNLCNFKCPNCHVFELGENNLPNRVMSQEIFDKAVIEFVEAMREANQSKTMISIYGGETLANKKVIKAGIEKFNEQIKDIQITWVVNTNGSLLNEEDILFFKKHDVEIHISVDGKEEIHNISRPTHKGKGTFHMVTPALELIKTHLPNTQINSYMMPSNYNHLRDIIDIAYEYKIKKIYLDQFYNLDMIKHEVGMQRYRDVYFYALSKGISISGPWAKVINRYHRFSPRRNEIFNRFAMDVNIDGSYYFPVNIESKKTFRHIDGFRDLVKSGEFRHIIAKGVERYESKCEGCAIKDHCLGTAIEQVHYHIGDHADVEVSCNFFRDWIGFLNRPVYFKKFKNIDVVSVIPLEKAQSLIEEVDESISKLEKEFWPLEERVILHLLEYPEELRGSSAQYNLPEWTVATTRGKNHFYHMGTTLSRGYMHELTHFFISQRKLNMPRWFIEGVCEWVRKPHYDDIFLKESLERHKMLDDIKQNPNDDYVLIELDQSHLDSNDAYYQVRSLVIDLVQGHGKDNFMKLLKSTASCTLFESFNRIYSYDLGSYIGDFLRRKS